MAFEPGNLNSYSINDGQWFVHEYTSSSDNKQTIRGYLPQDVIRQGEVVVINATDGRVLAVRVSNSVFAEVEQIDVE